MAMVLPNHASATGGGKPTRPGAVAPAAKRGLVAQILDTRASGILLVIALLLLWEATARFGWVQSQNWPPFSAVMVALYRNILSGELLAVIGQTLWVTLRGYLLGCGLGIVIGFAIAMWRMARLTLEPTIDIMRTIPTTAVIPPLIFVFGLGDPLKIFAVAFAVVFPMALSTASGAGAIDPIYTQVARTFGLPRSYVLRRVYFPAALPFIMAGLRTSLGLALIVTVVSEMIAGNSGIGFYLFQTQYAMRVTDMYAAIILLTIVAYLINRLFLTWEGRVIHWARTREAT